MQQLTKKLIESITSFLNFFQSPFYGFQKFPKSSKKGIGFLVSGWLFFVAASYVLLTNDNASETNILTKIITIGFCVCFLVLKGYNWGRMLCFLANALVILYCTFFITLFFEKDFIKVALCAVTIIMLSSATYYLAVKESSEYFKSLTKKYDEAENLEGIREKELVKKGAKKKKKGLG